MAVLSDLVRVALRSRPLVVVVAVLCAPAAAEASTFCVGAAPGPCLANYPASGDGLQAALDAADTNADISGTPDTVRIGPGTYARSGGAGFRTQGGSALSVEGAGESTVLTRTGTVFDDRIIDLKSGPGSAPGASLRNVKGVVNADMNGALYGFRNYSDIRLTGPAAPTVAVRVASGGRLSRAVIDPAYFRSAAQAVQLDNATLEDTLIRLRRQGTPSGSVTGVSAGGLDSLADNTIRHVTILGDGAPITTGVRALGYQSTAFDSTAFTHIRDTVIRGVPNMYDRQGNEARTVGTTTYRKSTAYLDIRYSSLGLGPAQHTESGPGDTTVLAGNLNDPDPLLNASARPTAGSPLIDAGDPGGALTGESATDAGGRARVFGRRRDIGAYEYVPGAPGSGGRPVDTSGDKTGPSLSAVGLSRKRFRAGSRNTATSARRRKAVAVGTRIRLTLSEAATVKFAIQRRSAGRTVRRKGSKRRVCVRPTRRNSVKANPRCRRYAKAKTLTRRLKAGRSSVPFSGRMARKRLTPGTYRLTLTAKDEAGNSGKPRAVLFTVVR